MPTHHHIIDAGTKAVVGVSTVRRGFGYHRPHAHVDLGGLRIEGAEGCDASELARILRQAADMVISEVDLLRGTPASNVTRLMRDLDDAVEQAVNERAERNADWDNVANSDTRRRIVANRTLTSLRAEAIDGKNNNPRDAA